MPAEHACQFIIGYEREVPGSDVADPRIRCKEPATVQLEDGMWVCAKHADESSKEQQKADS